MGEQVWALVNPGGGRGRTRKFLARLRAHAERSGMRFLVSESTEDLATHARAAAAAGVARLLVAGGDGTLHHTIQGLAGSATALGILPLGSGNDLAGALGVPEDLDQALELGTHGAIERIDLARAAGRYYGGVAGVGFDSEVNRYANERVKWIKGKLIYPYATLRWILPFRPPVMRVEHDEGVFEGPAMFAVVANSPRYGGGMLIAPGANLQDGMLDLIIVREISKLQLLMVFPKVFKGAHVSHPAVSVVRTRRAVLSLSRPIVAFGDGEPLVEVGSEPVEFAVVPRALSVVTGRRSK